MYVFSKFFALDIGTRSVVGIILEQQGEQFHVVDLISKEHKERAMVDGQIHNVIHVSSVIKEIKEELEEIHGPLLKVSVAAAGRALKTEQASTKLNLINRQPLTEDDIHRLELAAVQLASRQLLEHKEQKRGSHYYCVGYSVLYYRLDGQEIGSLLDQQGEEAEVEVIATFLPRVVVESLIAALKRADLEMEGLTLEPIAAINALIPSTMRRLNIALVDIGAGTSDIAITNKGTVVAYGMVPTAGDEITEALSDHYILDFPVAEEVKRSLSTQEEVLIADILGFEQSYPKEEIVDILRPAVTSLAEAIGQEIFHLNNHTAPKAILLVGGGSLTPEITTEICKFLQIPSNRAAVRGIDAIQKLTFEEHVSASPELVTPIGIAMAAKNTPIRYMSVEVNQQTVRLFELKEMTVADALLSANININRLYGKPGLAMCVNVNGQDIFVPGGHGEPTEIIVNNEKASIKKPIKNGDSIYLIEGKDGEAGTATIADIIEYNGPANITINDSLHEIEPSIRLNTQNADVAASLSDGDVLVFDHSHTIEECLRLTGQSHLVQWLEPFPISLDGQSYTIQNAEGSILVNNLPASIQSKVKDGDVIHIKKGECPSVQTVMAQMNLLSAKQITVSFQQREVRLEKECYQAIVNGEPVPFTTQLNRNDHVEFKAIQLDSFKFRDVFRYADWKMPEQFKGTFTLLRNNQPSTVEAEIFGGDQLSIQLVPAVK